MDAISFLKKQIAHSIPSEFKNIAELADKAGVNQPNLNSFMSGDRKSMKLETAWKLMHVLGIELQPRRNATIHRIGASTSKIDTSGEGMVSVPVYAVAGAGPAWDIQDAEPLFSIAAPPSFVHQSTFALGIDGESMYPTIKNGAVVGVNSDKQFRQNEIFAVRIPHEGLAVKRVAIDHARKEYVLRSDNPDKHKYDDVRIPLAEAPYLLVGRVVWVWQGV